MKFVTMSKDMVESINLGLYISAYSKIVRS